MVEADDSGSDRRRLIGLIAGGVATLLIIVLLPSVKSKREEAFVEE